MDQFKLKPYQLKRHWDTSLLPFNTTSEIEPYCDIIGQERAVRAMKFGVHIRQKGYNIYMCGISGTGRTTYAKEYLGEIAKKQKSPDDWCYVYNFENPSQPIAINLPSGMGREFQEDIHELILLLQSEIVKAFNGADYENEKTLIYKELQEKRNKIFNDFNKYAEEQGFKVNATKGGIFFTPIVDGNPIDEEEYERLDEDVKANINAKLTAVQMQAVEHMRKIKELEKEAKDKTKELENRIVLFSIGFHIDDLKEKYNEFPKVVKYLDGLKMNILDNIDDFKEIESDDSANIFSQIFEREDTKIKNRYSVNLFVDNGDKEGAPVIVEYNPTYNDLFGTLEYENRLGTLVTDFTMLKSGALHMANGGYLVLQANDVLSMPYMWEGLKKVLKTGKLSIENLRDQMGLMSISALKPESIPIDVKVILVGSEYVYHLLYEYDEEFSKLFKIKVDFDDEMEANYENIQCLAQFISSFCAKEGCSPFTNEAVIKVAEYSSRLVGNQEKLSTRFNEIMEILIEANAWAQIDGNDIITPKEVVKAIEEKERRSNKYDEKFHEMLEDGTIMIETEGKSVGQINGLSIVNLGDIAFGKPSKITATTYMGKSGVINIEREVEMSGTTHSKGVMILSSYIGEKYAQDIPLALTATVTFEQLYGGIDGDSASSTELYAILSSLSGVPIRQDIAVTGSINQKGEIQPVGGITHKIEGFYKLCKIRGLTGKQGVIIPRQNIRNLCLKDEVIESVEKGLFNIYAIENIDEGIEILTGIPAGKKLEDGSFEEGTIHEKVYNKLREYAINMVHFGEDNKG